MKIRLILSLFMLIPCAAQSQRDIETWEGKLKQMEWLIGEWEGIGFNSGYSSWSPMSFTYSADSLKIVIDHRGKRLLMYHLSEDDETFHVSEYMSVTEITIHIGGGDMRSDNTQLKIQQVGLKNMNVQYVYTRPVSDSGRVIFHGAFRKK